MLVPPDFVDFFALFSNAVIRPILLIVTDVVPLLPALTDVAPVLSRLAFRFDHVSKIAAEANPGELLLSHIVISVFTSVKAVADELLYTAGPPPKFFMSYAPGLLNITPPPAFNVAFDELLFVIYISAESLRFIVKPVEVPETALLEFEEFVISQFAFDSSPVTLNSPFEANSNTAPPDELFTAFISDEP